MSLSQPPIGTVVTTDPVTGLPLTSSDPGIIDQIPFNSDPRALQDWNATARASSSIYPDDYPWVMSTNHAQNSTNPQMAQSMQTDGNHRLLVNTGASSGGGLPSPTAVSGAELRSSVINDTIWTRANNWRFMTTVYAMDIYVELSGPPLASSRNRNLFGFTDAGDVDPSWWAFIVGVGPPASGMTDGVSYNSQHFEFGAGLNISTYLGRPLSDGIWVQMNNYQAPIYASVTLYGD